MEELRIEIISLKQEVLALKKIILEVNSPALQELIPAERVMEELDITRSTFDRLRKEGIIKTYKLKRKLFCKRKELLQALEPAEKI